MLAAPDLSDHTLILSVDTITDASIQVRRVIEEHFKERPGHMQLHMETFAIGRGSAVPPFILSLHRREIRLKIPALIYNHDLYSYCVGLLDLPIYTQMCLHRWDNLQNQLRNF